MARAVAAPKPPPAPEGPVVYEPDEGMAISTVKVTRTQDAYVAVEHPEGWGEAEVLAAIDGVVMDFAPKVTWWDADSTSSIDGVAVGENEPDDPHREPYRLGAPDPAEDEESD